MALALIVHCVDESTMGNDCMVHKIRGLYFKDLGL